MTREYSTLLLVAWYDGTRNKLGPDELRREFVLFCFFYRFLSNDATNYLSEDTEIIRLQLYNRGDWPVVYIRCCSFVKSINIHNLCIENEVKYK